MDFFLTQIYIKTNLYIFCVLYSYIITLILGMQKVDKTQRSLFFFFYLIYIFFYKKLILYIAKAQCY